MAAGGVNREYLNLQSDRIERVLAAHRVPVRVAGGSVLPRWIRFNVVPGQGTRVGSIRHLAEELALALGAPDVRVSRAGEQLALEVPRLDAEPVRLLPLLRRLGPVPALSACLGLADTGQPLLLRLPAPDVAHVLVAGTTGSGKTDLMRTIIVSLTLRHRQSQLQVALIDPKQRGFGPLARLPHLLAPPAANAAGGLAMLERLAAEMERRDAEQRSTPRILIAIDELAELMAAGGKAAQAALTRLAQRGREAGLHLLAGTQKPSSALLGPILKANFPVRLVGRVASAEDARVAAGLAGTGAERLLGRGDFIAVAGGRQFRFQAAWLSPQDIAQLNSHE
jgi:S-DNA-T family DNA segregation ATPase FtsK/SpoIIIE